MIRTISEIIKDKIFDGMMILAGKDGMDNEVKRISVFDCPCDRELVMGGVLRRGDFFITCLEQFIHDRDNINDFFDALIETESSGLIIVSDDAIHCLTDEIIEKCNKYNFPIILLKKDIPYAVIIDVFNQYISLENTNSINYLKIERVMFENLKVSDRMELLNSINPNMKQYLQVLYINGFFSSQLIKTEIYEEQLKENNNIFVWKGQNKIMIVSAESEKTLKHSVDAFYSTLKHSIPDVVIGYSRIHNKRDLKLALEEGKYALRTANISNVKSYVYDPISSLQLLLTMADGKEVNDYYRAYVNAVKTKVSEEGLQELLNTVEVYVNNAGSFKATAEIMNQHENTIRYRINRVKEALNMENDNIRFYETIGIATKLSHIVGSEDLDKM